MVHRFIKVPHLACRKIGEETVVLDVKSRSMFALNDDGAEALAILDCPLTASEVASRCSKGPSNEELVVQGVLSFLEELAHSGLLEKLDALASDEGHFSPDSGAEHASGAETGEWSPQLLWQEPLSTAVHMFQVYGPIDPPCQ